MIDFYSRVLLDVIIFSRVTNAEECILKESPVTEKIRKEVGLCKVIVNRHDIVALIISCITLIEKLKKEETLWKRNDG